MKRIGSWVVAALALLGAGCGGGGETGKVTVLLKDGPAEFSKAIVTITEIDLVGSNGTTVLTTNHTTTDLLTLANDTADLVKDAEVPVGDYSQLRFVISGACIEVGGVTYATSPEYEGLPAGTTVGGSLRMPSFAQSGLKVDLPGGSVSVGTAGKVLLVDFKVSQSFGQETGSGAWVMHPVVHATEFQLTGTVDVSVALAAGVTLPTGTTLADFSAVLTPAGGGDAVTLKLTPSTSGATAAFKYLFPGTYTVALTGPAGLTFITDPAVAPTVTVTSGQAAAASFVLTSVTAAP